MGNTIWIEAQGRSGDETHNDMNVLHALNERLDVLAEKLGVAKLTDFYDYRELLESFGDEELPDPSWFDSAKGLETVRKLLRHLEEDFSELQWKPDKSKEHWPQSLLEHLRFCQSVLDEAVASGRRFRLLVVA